MATENYMVNCTFFFFVFACIDVCMTVCVLMIPMKNGWIERHWKGYVNIDDEQVN